MKERKNEGAMKDALAGEENTLPEKECEGTVAGKADESGKADELGKTDESGRADVPRKSRQKTEPRYTRQQLAESARFRDWRDLVSALLEEGQQYTVAEADRMVREFMKGRVE